jgi:hypothetical protein
MFGLSTSVHHDVIAFSQHVLPTLHSLLNALCFVTISPANYFLEVKVMDHIEIETESEFINHLPLVHEIVRQEAKNHSIDLNDYYFAYCSLDDSSCSVTYYDNETGDSSFYLEFDLEGDLPQCTTVSVNGG